MISRLLVYKPVLGQPELIYRETLSPKPKQNKRCQTFLRLDLICRMVAETLKSSSSGGVCCTDSVNSVFILLQS